MWIRISALTILLLIGLVTLWGFVVLQISYYWFKELNFYQTWNTYVFEQNPVFSKPPMWNFWNLVRCIFIGVWVAWWWEIEDYFKKFVPIMIIQGLMLIYTFFCNAWALGLSWCIVVFNEVCMLLASTLLWWINYTSYDDIDLYPILYIILVCFNYTVNVARGLMDLYGAFRNRHTIYQMKNTRVGPQVKQVDTQESTVYNTSVKPEVYDFNKNTGTVTDHTEKVHLERPHDANMPLSTSNAHAR
jgi:hypothetical protein